MRNFLFVWSVSYLVVWWWLQRHDYIPMIRIATLAKYAISRSLLALSIGLPVFIRFDLAEIMLCCELKSTFICSPRSRGDHVMLRSNDASVMQCYPMLGLCTIARRSEDALELWNYFRYVMDLLWWIFVNVTINGTPVMPVYKKTTLKLYGYESILIRLCESHMGISTD